MSTEMPMTHPVRSKQISNPENYNGMTACVIGSGFGGMALAIRLQAAGVQTTVVESRDKPGGRAYFWEREGFIFDGGPTVITAPYLFDELEINIKIYFFHPH